MALRRKGLLMRLLAGLVLCFIAMIMLSDVAQGQEPVFGPQTYYRSEGVPITENDTFTVEDPSGEFLISITNGEGGEHRISSGWIWLNGVEEIHPSDFNQQVETTTKRL